MKTIIMHSNYLIKIRGLQKSFSKTKWLSTELVVMLQSRSRSDVSDVSLFHNPAHFTQFWIFHKLTRSNDVCRNALAEMS